MRFPRYFGFRVHILSGVPRFRVHFSRYLPLVSVFFDMCLRPLLKAFHMYFGSFFICLVNDILYASKSFSYVLFADDSNIFLSHPDLNTPIKSFNDELQHVFNWFMVNKLSRNISKTNYIHFCNRKNT